MKQKIFVGIITYSIACSLITACSTPTTSDPTTESEVLSMPSYTQEPQSTISPENPMETIIPTKTPSLEADTSTDSDNTVPITSPLPLRDNTPYCPKPSAPGTIAEGNDVTYIDNSNQSDGYIMVKYTGSCPKVKMILTGPNSYKCTYDLVSSEYQAFPLTAGNGSYSIGIYENIEGNSYSTAYSMTLNATLNNEFTPYLRPSQYVNYNEDTYAVSLASSLCENASSDLDCVSIIYNYIINNISYDYDKAGAAQGGKLSGYLPQIDASLNSGKGICLDYAAIMACMLRSQRIPTRLEVGYAADAYHAWISTYIEDIGWINGIIHFNGTTWSLLDPTFGATAGEEELREFIGDGTNYTVKYMY